MTATVPAPPVPAAPPPASSPPRTGRAARLLRGPAADPRWVRPALLGLLAATGVLYLWDLSASGWANAFYAAAAQAGSQSWEAFFYGSSDAANSITVDKPPASLWVMALSVRLFGLSSWSLLVPQALMGVATVGLVYLAVRRVAGPGTGLLAGAATALTPVAALMFRFDNPDALLVLLMTAAAYVLTRSLERASTRGLVGVGVLLGLAFLTKTLQAVLVVPGFALVWLVCAPTPLRRRVRQLLAAGAAMVVAGGWWVAVVELVPAAWRPYVGGSQTNSVWELIWGYNGLGRLTGEETGSVGGGAGGGWGETGLLRLFGAEVGGQVAWLLPAALALLVAGLVAVGRAPRTDPRRAALLTWGTWLGVTGLTFSLMAGIFHAYYTVALAPAIAALVAIGGALLWQRRDRVGARLVLALVLAGTALWAWVLLGRSADFLPWLRWAVLAAGLAAALGLVVVHRLGRAVAAVVLAAGLLAGVAGPAAYAVQTAATAHTGSIPSAGPTVAGAGFGGPGGAVLGRPPAGAGGGAPGGLAPGAAPGNTAVPVGPRGGAGGGMGGLLEASDVGEELVAALTEDADGYTWAAAAVGSNNAAGYQLATGLPVMAIGGFNGSDPSPTLEQFQRHVADGEIHWFVGHGMGMAGDGGSSASAEIAAWVAENFTAQRIDGVTVYDLSRPAG
ncbi:4-amino-4-deoxy-L-arabinose transferase-like glycosyltransferase [Geodermatophilus tzadiensis]|uniref:4-amino-4-deoxy-L-arabinose transferase-like glycosyltransferase n=1 Tax=Geodermatophilus tzadiensis TaxID=1137988 RepID=A0A2T0TZK3_9ACTN|nr:glycosyltransferase family 39 protein [Geodermatophilus tzadiensis]PRY51089.1 4-amino-4-deoxy-L-arabinose transferase-like glycosyltransferase [Geodermatophilus tzadiensis]